MGWGSTTPAAISGLLTAFKSSPDLTGVKILDGPEVTTGATEAITVGYSDDPAVQVAVDAVMAMEGLAANPSHEQYMIHCAVSVLRGNGDIAAARARVYELFGAVGAALAADPRLGGAVMLAQISSYNLTQAQGSKGALAILAFTVEVEAFTTR